MTGQVEGAVKYVVAKRCDHGGMRWIRQRAQAVIQLRCIDVNGHWPEFVGTRPPPERRADHRPTAEAPDELRGKPALSGGGRMTEADLHPTDLGEGVKAHPAVLMALKPSEDALRRGNFKLGRTSTATPSDAAASLRNATSRALTRGTVETHYYTGVIYVRGTEAVGSHFSRVP
jgi:hypothetical protein